MKKLFILLVVVLMLTACGNSFNHKAFIKQINEFSKSKTALMRKNPSGKNIEEIKTGYAKLIESKEFSDWKKEADEVIFFDTSNSEKEISGNITDFKETMKAYVVRVEKMYTELSKVKDSNALKKVIKENSGIAMQYEKKIVTNLTKINNFYSKK